MEPGLFDSIYSQLLILQLELEEVRRQAREELTRVHDKLDAEIASKNDVLSTNVSLTYLDYANFEQTHTESFRLSSKNFRSLPPLPSQCNLVRCSANPSTYVG